MTYQRNEIAQRGPSAPAVPAKPPAIVFLESAASLQRVADVLPVDEDAMPYVKAAVMEIARDAADKRNLEGCTPQSFLFAMMEAASLRLQMGKTRGHAWFVPFKGKATFMLGYRGMIELAYRTGQFTNIDAKLVYEADDFEIYYDPLPRLTHHPSAERDRGQVTHAYAYSLLKGASHPDIEVMTIHELEAIRQAAPGGNSDAWRKHPGEMYRKTVLRRHLKKRPSSTDLVRAFEIEDVASGYLSSGTAVKRLPGESKSAALARSIGGKALPPPVDDDAEFADDEQVEVKQVAQPAKRTREPGEEG